MTRRFTSTIIALLIILALGQAAPVLAKDTWISVRSKNFFLVGNASEKEIRQVATRLEQFREAFTRLFRNMRFTSSVPTTVVVFESDSAYAPFKVIPNTAGYFQPGPDVNYITLNAEARGQQDPFNVIFHEYTHLLVNNTIGDAPTWFNEGLAEYYSTVQVSDEKKVVRGSPISNHVYLLRQKKMLPLRTLFQVDHKSPYYNERDKQSVFYAESWALMHYLILGNNGSRAQSIDKFVRLLGSNVPMEQAFRQAFQMTFEELEKELRDYIQHDRYPVLTSTFEEKLAVDTEMQSAPLTEAEVQAYLGDLLLHSNRPESEKYLQKALALDPNLAMAHASLGMLRVREGKIDEARRSLERAVAANSQNYLTHYYYALALSRETMGDDHVVNGYTLEALAKIREELQKAIKLRPDFPESYNLLAFINLVNGSQIDESIVMIKRVLTTSPGRADLLLTLAQLYLRSEDYKSAGDLLERLSQNKSNSEIAEHAGKLLAQMKLRQEQMAKFEKAREDALAGPSAKDTDPHQLPRLGGTTNLESKAEEYDPASALRDALRLPEANEKRIQGTLLRIECDAKGIVFFVQTTGGLLRLKTLNFETINITTFNSGVSGEINCGPRKGENIVVVCYVPGADARARIDGQLRSVEFVPSDFILKT
ncbi:MAG: tetratricopeptide repeat protein [bacterium]